MAGTCHEDMAIPDHGLVVPGVPPQSLPLNEMKVPLCDQSVVLAWPGDMSQCYLPSQHTDVDIKKKDELSLPGHSTPEWVVVSTTCSGKAISEQLHADALFLDCSCTSTSRTV